MVEMVMACRGGRPLLVVDVALPRDVDPGVGDITDVTLLDLDDLKEYAQRSAERRRGEIGKVRAILAAEIERYRADRAGARGRAARHVAARARRRRAPAASSSASAPSSRSSTPTSARAGRGDHAGHRQQAAARADGPREGRGRHAARRLLRRRARRAVRPAVDRGLIRWSGSPMIRIATRASALARWQAERVGALLGASRRARARDHHRRPRPDAPTCTRSAGTGVFTKEVQQAVLDGRADIAVHSAKDLPSETPAGPRARGGARAGRPARRARRCARSTRSRPAARIGHRFGAPPRAARGGPPRPRVRRRCAATSRRGSASASSEGYDAVVVAFAALERLGLGDRSEPRCSTPRVMLPQVAQGALAVECRADDARDHRAARARSTTRPRTARCDAERAFLAELGGGCDLPCGALAPVDAARRARSCSRRCSRRSTVTSCCARRVRGRRSARRRRPRPRATCSTARAAARCSTASCRRERRVTVYLVGAGPGDPGLLTRRGEELLRARRRRGVRPARVARAARARARRAPSSSTSARRRATPR